MTTTDDTTAFETVTAPIPTVPASRPSPFPTRPAGKDELRHLRALDAEVARFLAVLDARMRAGWMKVPRRELEQLRAMHEALTYTAVEDPETPR